MAPHIRLKKWVITGTYMLTILVAAMLAAIITFEYLVIPLFAYSTDFEAWSKDVDHRLERHMVDVNSDQIRCFYEADYFRDEDTSIIFLGDSFIYGHRQPGGSTIPIVFEQIAQSQYPSKNIKAVNFGWTSSSPFLSERLLREVGAKYKPDRVVLAIDMTDIRDDLLYYRAVNRKGLFWTMSWAPNTLGTLRYGIGAIPITGIRNAVFEALFSIPPERFFHMGKPLSETRHWFARMQISIDAIARYTREELNAEFTLFILPRNIQYSERESPASWETYPCEALGPYVLEPFRYFTDLADTASYPVHSLLPAFQTTSVFPTCFIDDPHWNEAGQRVAATAIYDYAENAGWFDSDE
jgi:hypothetical protein